jgi:uncharacterized protein (DUF4415 family)
MDLRFEWDERKDTANQRKHGVSFEEALGTKGRSIGADRIRKEVVAMKTSYDFSKGKRNPYAKRLKRQITIRLDATTIAYFNALAEETGIPYQSLINLYLRECAASHKRLDLRWRPSRRRTA